jgi:signal transduction histidine kinase/ligand-binding sensor domain-containing protein/DNA-binding NarL/FixJ family response regulator
MKLIYFSWSSFKKAQFVSRIFWTVYSMVYDQVSHMYRTNFNIDNRISFLWSIEFRLMCGLHKFRNIVVLSLLVFLCLPIVSQDYTQFTHYTVDEGLSENNVLCMLQDRKGMMWFGTYDGLNKFDGYTFKTYKGSSGGQAAGLLNYRVDHIREDNDGYLWVKTYDGRIYRFDPGTEKFLPVPQCIPEYENYRLSLTGVFTLSDGSIWIAGGDHGEDDCFRILNTKKSEQVRITHFNTTNGQLTSNKIKKIYLDKAQNTWILTTNGINLLKRDSLRFIPFFKEKKEGASCFLTTCENFPFMYFGGGLGRLLVYDNRNQTFEDIKTPFLTKIIDIRKINSNELFLLTDKSGFFIYNLKTRIFRAFDRLSEHNLKSDYFFSCYMDKQHNIWLDTDNSSVVYFETGKREITNFVTIQEKSVTSGHIFFVLEDKFDNIWVQPRNGGFSFYNRETNKLEPFYNDPKSRDRKFSNSIRNATSDRQGNLWMCPYISGIEKIVFRKSTFEFYKPVPSINYSDQNQVRCLYEDQDNRLWVATRNGYLYLYDSNYNLIGQMGADGKINSSKPFNVPIFNIVSDHTGTIWLASKGKGLFKVTKNGDNKYATFSLVNYRNNPNDVFSLSSDAVYSIFEDHMHRLWVATYGGGINLMETQKGNIRFINYRNKFKSYPKECIRVRYITEDNKGRIYAGTIEGLVAFQGTGKSAEDIKFYRYCHDPVDKHSISGNDVHYVLPSKSGDLYLGIYGGGLDVLINGIDFQKKPEFKAFMKNNGSPSDIVLTLLEDQTGDIWLSTQTKIVKFNRKTEKFDVYSPITSSEYSFVEAALCKTHHGDLIYGTTEGFIRFNPHEVMKSQFVPRIVFTQLQLLNKPVEVGGASLPRIIDDMPELNLTHKQNILSIGFSALDYSDPQGLMYAYKLDGIDADWNYVGKQRIATYTNLPKGNYKFRVKSTNADGEWVNNERSILIKKIPSFWESSWGYLFYLFVFLSITFLATYILFTFYRLKNDVIVEHWITDMKLRFFTDVSHELRTPLTLIVSPVENILRKEVLSDKVKDQLVIVKRNIDRMLRLVNQILDFHKILNKKMQLEIEDIQVGQIVNEICSNFLKLAEDRNIEFSFVDNSNNAHLWIDKDKFEKILFNLLSNAFKFTQSGSSIEVFIVEESDVVSITVRDKGVGIDKEKMKRLFKRFESIGSIGYSSQPCTGIGLSLTKELADLHKATIDVESEPGKGSSFKVTFMKGHKHFSENDDYVLKDVTFEDTAKISIYDSHNDSDDAEVQKSIHVPAIPTIMIVEDNAELRNFLSSVLRNHYNILEAENGMVALKLLPDSAPDLIVSDVMMPEMTGLELAKAIKEDINVSHIPLVLLTAKNDIDSKLEAMGYGVDDYITKPFSSAYLEARIENLLKLRKQLQDYYRMSLTSGVISISKPNVTSHDDLFIQRIMKFIEENIEDSELSIDGIATFIGLSRSSMFKKIKSLTDLAPVDFIKEIRIQRAAQLIETGEFNISQVTYMVGMTDPRYFSKCFKQKFGVSPREYKERCQS